MFIGSRDDDNNTIRRRPAKEDGRGQEWRWRVVAFVITIREDKSTSCNHHAIQCTRCIHYPDRSFLLPFYPSI